MWTLANLNNGKPNSGRYGFGWYIESTRVTVSLSTKAPARIRDPISRYVDDKLTVVVLTNLAEAKPGRIAHGVARIYLEKGIAGTDRPSVLIRRSQEINTVQQ